MTLKAAIRLCSFVFCCQTVTGQTDIDLKTIDVYARKVPVEISESLDELTEYLTHPYEDNVRKVRSIYSWISQHIRYDKEARDDGSLSYNYDPERILKKKKAVCTGFSNLFKEMCSLSGMEAYVISGYSQGTLTSSRSLEEPDHAWNAILLNGSWYLLDVTWGSGLYQNSIRNASIQNSPYFLSPPESFIADHLPAMPFWQLLECPISVHEFIEGPDIRDQTKINCISFRDSIDHFLQMSLPERKIYEYRHTYKNNPTKGNLTQLGHGLMDYAGILSDSLEVQGQSLDTKSQITLLEKMIRLCEEASGLIEMHAWQKELFATILINNVVVVYNARLYEANPKKWNLDLLLRRLQRAHAILESLPSNFFRKGSLQSCEKLLSVLNEKTAH